VGVEDGALYERNRTIFIAHLAKAQEIQEKLRAYGASLEDSQKSAWGPDLLAFGNAFGKFRETTDLGKFFPLLLKTAGIQDIDAADLAQITLLKDITALEKSLSKEKLEQEIKNLMQEYKNTPWTLEELIRGNKIPAEKLGFYPEIQKLNRLYQMRDQISLRDLTAQIETLTGRVLEKLVKTPQDRSFWEKTGRFYLAKRILLLQATPSDMAAYGREKSSLESELAGAGLSEGLALSLDFYETVKKRDEIFFEKIMTDPSLAGNIAVVTGGFHTDGLSQKFRGAGISYITITPDLSGASMDEKLYNERMRDNRGTENGERIANTLPEGRSPVRTPIGGQTLSEFQNAIAWIDECFFDALEVLFQTKDVRKAIRSFLGESIRITDPEKIRRLAAQGRLHKNQKSDLTEVSSLREQEFLELPRSKQIEIFRQWRQTAEEARHRSMLVSSVDVLQKMLASAKTEERVKALTGRGDLLALLQDVAPSETPPALLMRGIERFQAPDLDAIQKNPLFLGYARQRPYVIMKNNYQSKNRVVVDEDPVWLELLPVLTLSAQLYENARDRSFLELLKALQVEVLSQELPKKSV
jgi:hypothetical protein